MIPGDLFLLLFPFLLMVMAESMREEASIPLHFFAATSALVGVAFPSMVDADPWFSLVYIGVGLTAMVRGFTMGIKLMERRRR